MAKTHEGWRQAPSALEGTLGAIDPECEDSGVEVVRERDIEPAIHDGRTVLALAWWRRNTCDGKRRPVPAILVPRVGSVHHDEFGHGFTFRGEHQGVDTVIRVDGVQPRLKPKLQDLKAPVGELDLGPCPVIGHDSLEEQIRRVCRTLNSRRWVLSLASQRDLVLGRRFPGHQRDHCPVRERVVCSCALGSATA